MIIINEQNQKQCFLHIIETDSFSSVMTIMNESLLSQGEIFFSLRKTSFF